MRDNEWISEVYGLVKSAHLALVEAVSVMSCMRDKVVVENVDVRETIRKLAIESERAMGLLCIGIAGSRGEQ